MTFFRRARKGKVREAFRLQPFPNFLQMFYVQVARFKGSVSILEKRIFRKLNIV